MVRTDVTGGESTASDLAMEELFGEGAGVVIAGLDETSADHALKWGEAHGLPVVLLHPPARMPTMTQAGYVLGEARATQLATLAQALAKLGDPRAQLLATAPEPRDPKDPRQVRRARRTKEALEAALAQGGLQRARETVDCAVEAPRPGLPRFPYQAWARERVRTFAVAGARGCLADVLAEVKLAEQLRAGVPGKPAVGFLLDADRPPAAASASARLFAVSAGILPLPLARAEEIGDPELAAFYKEFGQVPGWWAALGRDAGLLTRQAVSMLPVNTTQDPKAVAQRHAIVAAALGRATAPLWTTDALGFAGGRVIARTVRVVELK